MFFCRCILEYFLCFILSRQNTQLTPFTLVVSIIESGPPANSISKYFCMQRNIIACTIDIFVMNVRIEIEICYIKFADTAYTFVIYITHNLK